MQRFRERAGTLHEEKETLVCRKTSTSSHIEYKKRELLARKTIASCILSRQRNGFELSWEIPSVEGVFSPRTNILDDVSVSLASAQQTANISTYEYYLYLWTKYYERELSSLAVKQDNENGWEKKGNIFLFLFSARSVRHWMNQCHAPNYPALSMCVCRWL